MEKNPSPGDHAVPAAGETKRGSRALRDRRVQQPIVLDQLRALAMAGLTLEEITARLRCAPESLQQPEIMALIEQARVNGNLLIRSKLRGRALEGNYSAMQFLLEQDAQVRIEADLQGVVKALAEMRKEYQAAVAAGQDKLARKLERQLKRLQDFQSYLQRGLADFVRFKVPVRPPQLTRWQRAQALRQHSLEEMTEEELHAKIAGMERGLRIVPLAGEDVEARLTKIGEKLQDVTDTWEEKAPDPI